MEPEKFFQSKGFKITMMSIGCVAIFLLVLGLGMFIGYKKARFSYGWGEYYHENFGGPPPPPPFARGGSMMGLRRDLQGKDFLNAHGTSGSIMKIEGKTIFVNDETNLEKTIITSDSTAIRKKSDVLKLADLKVGDKIVVIGSPDDKGQISAELIRVF